MKDFNVKDIEYCNDGAQIKSSFLLVAIEKKSNPRRSWGELTLADCTGTVIGKVFDENIYPYNLNSDLGKILNVKGQVNKYQGEVSLIIQEISECTDYEKNSDYQAYEDLDAISCDLAMIRQNEIKQDRADLIGWLDYIYKAPGNVYGVLSNIIHGETSRGSWEKRTVEIAKNCLALSDTYDSIDKDLLLTAALTSSVGDLFCVDMGEFGESLDNSGLLVGPAVKSCTLFAIYNERGKINKEVANKLCHMFLASGGLIEPAFAEAEILRTVVSMMDRINLIKEDK